MSPGETALLPPRVPACNKTVSSSWQARLSMEPLSVHIPSPTESPPVLGSGDMLLGKKNGSLAGSAQLKPLRTDGVTSPSPQLPSQSPSSPIMQEKIFCTKASLPKISALADPPPVQITSPTNSSPVVLTPGSIPYRVASSSEVNHNPDNNSNGCCNNSGSAIPAVPTTRTSPILVDDSLNSATSKKVLSRRHHVVPPVQPVSFTTSAVSRKRSSRVDAIVGESMDVNGLLAVKPTVMNPNTAVLAPVQPANIFEKEEERECNDGPLS